MIIAPNPLNGNANALPHPHLAYTVHLSCTAHYLAITGGTNDFIHFLDDDGASDTRITPNTPWIILITDDDKSVHESTVLALQGVAIQGRPLEFLHAYSASEGHELLLSNPEIALILLDVVMETVDAGFRLVEIIREELQRTDLRIVVRTGQPGTVKKLHESHNAAIDAYTVKSKITRSMLVELLENLLAPSVQGKAN